MSATQTNPTNATNNAGFPPAPPKARQQASVGQTKTVKVAAA